MGGWVGGGVEGVWVSGCVGDWMEWEVGGFAYRFVGVWSIR